MNEKIIVVDDENQLYTQMFADLWDMDGVEQIPRISIPKFIRLLYKAHFSTKVNSIIELPFKNVWERFYVLGKYDFKPDENYIVVILNGALKNHFSMDYLKKIKSKHSNIKYALIFFDVYKQDDYHNGMDFNLFDKILSFDKQDCLKYGFTYIPQGQVFSMPKNLSLSKDKQTELFFVGMGAGRYDILNETARKLEGKVDYKIHVVGTPKDKQVSGTHIIYNEAVSYEDEMEFVYNTNTVLDVAKEGQSGITLRVCEALLFNKKILTNNETIRQMPFYNPLYIYIYKEAKDIDISFIKDKREVNYGLDKDYFSPKRVIELLIDYD